MNKKVNRLAGFDFRFSLFLIFIGFSHTVLADTSFSGTLLNQPSLGAEGVEAHIASADDIDDETQAPWMASLHNTYNEAFCGAVLIDQQHLLTAAHCVAHLVPNQYSVVFGHNLYSSETHEVGRTWLPVGFRWSHLSEDIAIIRLKTPVDITPLAIADRSVLNTLNNGDSLQILGFGQMEESGSLSPTLKQGTVPYVTPEACANHWRSEYPSLAAMIDEESLCASGMGYEVDTCLGDSGGPLLLYDQSWQLLGITSFGEKTCGNAEKPSVYVRPAAFTDAIQKAIDGEAYYANWLQTLVGDDPALSKVTVTIENTSDQDWALADIAADVSSAFQLSNNSCLNLTLAPGASCDVDFEFSPKSGGFTAQRFLMARDNMSPIWIDLQGFGFEFVEESSFGNDGLFGFAGGEFMPSVKNTGGYEDSAYVHWQGMQPLETSELYIGAEGAQDVTVLLDYTPAASGQAPVIYIETLSQFGQKEKFEVDNQAGWQYKTVSLQPGDYVHVTVQSRGHGLEGAFKLDVATAETVNTTDIAADSLDSMSKNNVQRELKPQEVQFEAGGSFGIYSLIALMLLCLAGKGICIKKS